MFKYRPPARTGFRPGRSPSRGNGESGRLADGHKPPSRSMCMPATPRPVCFQYLIYSIHSKNCPVEIPLLSTVRDRNGPIKSTQNTIERGPQYVAVLSILRLRRTTAPPKVCFFVLKHPQTIQAQDRRFGHVFPQTCAPRRTNTTSKVIRNLIRLPTYSDGPGKPLPGF